MGGIQHIVSGDRPSVDHQFSDDGKSLLQIKISQGRYILMPLGGWFFGNAFVFRGETKNTGERWVFVSGFPTILVLIQ